MGLRKINKRKKNNYVEAYKALKNGDTENFIHLALK